MKDRRKHKRVYFRAEGICRIEGESIEFIIFTRDISLEGLGFVAFTPAAKDKTVRIEIPVDVFLNLDSRNIRLKGKIMWQDFVAALKRYKAGLKIESISQKDINLIKQYCGSHSF